jgi:poly-gamma-glutamate capsule biosynthesis protein CapA/YwtB (metallophosphatase superfamily)
MAEAAEPIPTREAPEASNLPAFEATKTSRNETVYVTFAAVGDIMLGTDYPDHRLPDDDGVSFLGEVASFLRSADLTFGNLEGVLVDGGTPAKKCSNPNACYLFRSPTRYARHYVDAGFDALSLANNHARDFGEDGRSSSMQALADAGIAHSGRVGDFATLEANGLTVSFVAFSVTRESNLLHDYALAAQIVTEQAARHDLVVVSFHGGAEGQNTTRVPFAEEEYFGEPRGDVVRFARSMVDSGADFVFGHGPHVVRGMERYRDRLIAYSLGNFATYYGISVSGIKGIAPILTATVDQDGRFIEGRVHSTVQVRPGGPRIDENGEVLALLRNLTEQDFPDSGLHLHADGLVSRSPQMPAN